MQEIYMCGPDVTEYEEKIVLDALRNCWYGKQAYYYVELFEKEFAEYHRRQYALMTPNCTSAIHLLLSGLGIKEGDEVIVPDCTWIGTAAPVVYQRAIPVFADIDEYDWCIRCDDVISKITSKTKAVIAVDLYGNMPNFDSLADICNKNNLFLIEDAAEALGSKYNNKPAGKFGIGSTFSFHRTKTITTGEGGMLLLDDEKLYQRCKFLRDHGRSPGSYFSTEVTFKYMPSNLAAALGYAQFKRLDELVNKKRWIWQSFKNNFSDMTDLYFNPEPENVFNGVWDTAMVFGYSHNLTKAYVLESLNKANMPSRPFFYPLSMLPAFGGNVVRGQQNCPVAYSVSERGINLPCSLILTKDQIDFMSEVLRKIILRQNV
ncbi:MAG: DegT/DnrJ/EryC1/StrS family aminotransferase [Holosporales bacterium]|jgi:perosamine synthetase|nr:DegT/DnrJ/EryC1/StrS family aminotransferase [Holosporales bacterium]